MKQEPANRQTEATAIVIRSVDVGDLDDIVRLDRINTGLAKPGYWKETFERFDDRYFLVAEDLTLNPDDANGFLGFIAGEVRAWEFGSPPCGWILTIGVEPDRRVGGIGTKLFGELCRRMQADGVETMRTMLAREDHLNMAFFRSQGLMAGSFIELEMELSGLDRTA